MGYGVAGDAETKEPNVVRAGRELEIAGRDISVDASRSDEGVWLERRTRGKIAQTEVVESTAQSAKIVFSEVPPAGKYTFALVTRCGKPDFSPRRCLADVQIL